VQTIRWGRSSGAARLALGVALIAKVGRADDRSPPDGASALRATRSPLVDVHASDVEIDARTREVVLKGDVRVDAPPFHLTSDELRVRRTARGAVEVEGAGRLRFCPCLGSPLAVRFEEATVAPPGDLILRSPSLEVLGAPVLWLPYFWLRAPEKPGFLPPDVAYRGADGMFLGEGIHVPLARGDGGGALDLRAGGYFEGGAAVDGLLATRTTSTRVAWDHLRGDGVTVDARGAIENGAAALAWDADAIRGARGLVATTDLDAAARPYDRFAGETSWRDGGWTIGTGLYATAPRGGGLLDGTAVGPLVTLRRGGTLGDLGAYDAEVEGGGLREAGTTGRAVSFLRGEAGSLIADRWGPLGASLALRAAGDVAADGGELGGATSGADGAASARARVGLPFGRAFASEGQGDPWVHRVEPAVEAAVLSVHGDGLLGVTPGRGMSAVGGNAWIADMALASEQGRWGARVGSEVSAAAGAVGSFEAGGSTAFVTRGHAALSASWGGLTAEGARVWDASGNGGAFVARARLGGLAGPHLVVLAAERDGVDPVVARALTDAPLEPSGGFLSATGWTGGARARIPWTYWLATTGGADVDLTAQVLLSARGGIEVRDQCGCLRVRANAAHRLGRDGVDAWVTIDLAPR
jgi:hypothetical protein